MRVGAPMATEPTDVARAGDARAPVAATSEARGATRAGPAPGVDGAYGSPAALRFVGRLAQLELAAVRAAVGAWRETMRDESAAWFAAEEAVARAVVASGRHHEQRPLLIHLADAFANHVWYRARRHLPPGAPAPELRVRATEASGQYLGTLAMLALLVRDRLEPATFARLYRPFAPHVPVAELGRE